VGFVVGLPAIVLALGAALIWAIKGFTKDPRLAMPDSEPGK